MHACVLRVFLHTGFRQSAIDTTPAGSTAFCNLGPIPPRGLYVVLVHVHSFCYKQSNTHTVPHVPDVYYAFVHSFHGYRSINLLINDIANGQQHGDLRLMDGFVQRENFGRLEIFDASTNQWGTICGEGFTQFSADTACRQLGSARANRFDTAVNLG